MVELGYLGFCGTSISRICGTRISRIWWNYDISDIVELGYPGYVGTRIFMICWSHDIYDMVEL